MIYIKKFSFKITVAIILSSLIIITSLTFYSYYFSKQIYKQEANQILTQMVNIQGLEMEKQLQNSQMLADVLKQSIITTIDISEASKSYDNMEKYEDSVSPTFLGLLHSFNAKSCWMVFNPEITKIYDLGYMTFMNNFNKGAQGDLTVQMEVKSNDELGIMSKDFNKFINRLHSTITDINNVIDKANSYNVIISQTMDNVVNGPNGKYYNSIDIRIFQLRNSLNSVTSATEMQA